MNLLYHEASSGLVLPQTSILQHCNIFYKGILWCYYPLNSFLQTLWILQPQPNIPLTSYLEPICTSHKKKPLQITMKKYVIKYHIEESNIKSIPHFQICPIPFFGHLKIKPTQFLELAPLELSSQLPSNIRLRIIM